MMARMASKKDVLTQLSRAELLSFVSETGVEVADRRVREQLIVALSGSKRARLPEFLLTLSADRLKEIAQQVGAEGGGRNKALIVETIVGAGAKPRASASAASSSARGTRGTKIVRSAAATASAPLRASKKVAGK